MENVLKIQCLTISKTRLTKGSVFICLCHGAYRPALPSFGGRRGARRFYRYRETPRHLER
jgi:hypothetical protein